MDGKIDAEALFGTVGELLAEGDADIGDGDALAVAHDRRHREGEQRIAAWLDADDRLAGPVRLDNRGAARRDVVVEGLRVMDAQEDLGRWQGEVDERHALRLQGGQG